MQAVALRTALIVMGALSLAGCGGGGGSKPGTSTGASTGSISNGGPGVSLSDSVVQQTQQIKQRLTKAGYVVHDVKRPASFAGGPTNATTLAHGPQQTFLAVDKQTDQTYTRLYGQLATITRTAHARAVKNLPTTPQTFRLLATLSASIKSLGHREFNVLVFNSADDASTYGKSNFAAQNSHVLALPGANDLDVYTIRGSVIYFMPVVENEGKVPADRTAFDRLVAVAQGTG